MVDEQNHEVASEPLAGAQIDRDASPVTEGEIASQEHHEAASSPAENSRAEAAPQPTRRAGAGRAFFSGALGGLVVSALAAGGGYYLLAPKADLAEADARRLAAIELQAQRQNAAVAALEKRVEALQGANPGGALASIDKRVSGLEASKEASSAELDQRLGALRADASKVAQATQAIQSLTGEVKDLRADVDAARGELPALSARVAKLESGAPQQAEAAADLPAITGRLDKLEAQLAQAKGETRAAPERPAARDNPAAVAIVAEALRDKLAAGAPFRTELGALESLGVEPAKLAPLKAMADGAPTDPALAADFEAVRSRVLDAAAPPTQGVGIADRFLARLRGLVQVRDLNETAGDDPAALISRIEVESRRGDLSGALAAFAKLPEPSREAASAWASQARAKEAAAAALQSIREAAVARLAESGKP